MSERRMVFPNGFDVLREIPSTPASLPTRQIDNGRMLKPISNWHKPREISRS